MYNQRRLSDASIYHWMREFCRGRTRIVDKTRMPRNRSGRSRANVRKVEDMVEQDRRVSVARMSLLSGISPTSVHRILKLDLHLVKKCAKFVPHVLEQIHLDTRVRVCNFMVRLTSHTPCVLSNIVTKDESWVYIYDPELRQQSKEWLRQDQPRPQKPRRNQFGAKVMLVSFIDSHGLVYS